MPRRQTRRASAPPPANRRPRPTGGNWRYWVMVAIVALLALVMIVTSLPAQ
jgi:type II secretory pathway component PulL